MEDIRPSDSHSAHGAHGSMGINGIAMDLELINEKAKLGVWERWRVTADMMMHPFHIHGCSFLIETQDGEAVTPDQAGWKDMVVADDEAWSSVLVRFNYPADEQHPYMYHCHILEHEDHGMMGQFTVS